MEQIRKPVTQLRIAIKRALSEHPEQDELRRIKGWPQHCCDNPYLFMRLYDLGHRRMVRYTGDVSPDGKGVLRHFWWVVNGLTIDITANQFDGVPDEVIVTPRSDWHAKLRIIQELEISEEKANDLHMQYRRCRSHCNLYFNVLPMYAPPLESV